MPPWRLWTGRLESRGLPGCGLGEGQLEVMAHFLAPQSIFFKFTRAFVAQRPLSPREIVRSEWETGSSLLGSQLSFTGQKNTDLEGKEVESEGLKGIMLACVLRLDFGRRRDCLWL